MKAKKKKMTMKLMGKKRMIIKIQIKIKLTKKRKKDKDPKSKDDKASDKTTDSVKEEIKKKKSKDKKDQEISFDDYDEECLNALDRNCDLKINNCEYVEYSINDEGEKVEKIKNKDIAKYEKFDCKYEYDSNSKSLFKKSNDDEFCDDLIDLERKNKDDFNENCFNTDLYNVYNSEEFTCYLSLNRTESKKSIKVYECKAELSDCKYDDLESCLIEKKKTDKLKVDDDDKTERPTKKDKEKEDSSKIEDLSSNDLYQNISSLVLNENSTIYDNTTSINTMVKTIYVLLENKDYYLEVAKEFYSTIDNIQFIYYTLGSLYFVLGIFYSLFVFPLVISMMIAIIRIIIYTFRSIYKALKKLFMCLCFCLVKKRNLCQKEIFLAELIVNPSRINTGYQRPQF